MGTQQESTMRYSVLSNGIAIPGHHRIGSWVRTQWGLRQVVRHIVEPAAAADDMPPGV